MKKLITILCLSLMLVPRLCLGTPLSALPGRAWERAPCFARVHRSSSVRRRFLHDHRLTHTPAGCQVDHVVPLQCGGKDERSNLWLLCGDALKEKERLERRRNCKAIEQWVKDHPDAGER